MPKIKKYRVPVSIEDGKLVKDYVNKEFVEETESFEVSDKSEMDKKIQEVSSNNIEAISRFSKIRKLNPGDDPKGTVDLLFIENQ